MAVAGVKKENHALRTVTAILMFFIAGAHYYSRAKIGDVRVNDVIFDVGRFAIPVLVLTSGYFCYSADGHVENDIVRKMKHILYLIVIYKLFYLMFSTALVIAGKADFEYVLMEFLIVSPSLEFGAYDGSVSLETTQPIWFVYALLLIYLFWWILWKKGISFKVAVVISAPLVLISLIVGEFMPMFDIDYVGDTNISDMAGMMYPFITLPFFTMGYYMHKHMDWLDRNVSNIMIWAMMAFGAVLTFIEAYLVGTSSIIYVSSIIVAATIFLGTFRVPEDKGRIAPLIFIGRNLTMWMYVFFGAACLIMRWIMESHTDSYWLSEVAGPILTVILDMLMALAFHYLLKYISRQAALRH